MKKCTSIWKLKRLLSKLYDLFTVFLVYFPFIAANTSEVPCPPGMFQCQEGTCIPSLWVCNYQKDCPRGEDELQSCRKYHFVTVDFFLLFLFLWFGLWWLENLIYKLYYSTWCFSTGALLVLFFMIFAILYIKQKILSWKKKWKLVTVHNFFWDWQLFLPFLCLMKKSESCLRKALACLSQCDAFYLFSSSVISVSIIFFLFFTSF